MEPWKRVFFLLSIIGFISLWGGEHPSLPDPSKTRCITCHQNLVIGKVHPIVEEGCENCHEMNQKEGKTSVSLIQEGNSLCFMCHPEKENWEERKSPHPALEDCTTCHNPHASPNPSLLKDELPSLCFSCHDKKTIKKEIHKEQPVHATLCITCHNPHGNDEPHALKEKKRHPPFDEASCLACHRKTRTRKARFRVKQPDLCYACHSDKEETFDKTYQHKPLQEGKCTACHDPHQSSQQAFLQQNPPDLCFRCHPEVKEALKHHPHPPAEEDCFTCHDPHASNRPHLLQEDMLEGDNSTLCAQCHDWEDLKPKHLSKEMEGLACTLCHNPHGSPKKHLIQATSIHPPFEEGCDTCHEDGQLVEEIPDLCYMCHDAIQEVVESASIPHPALEEGCTVCHFPHASPQKFLFRGSQIEVCGECHDMKYPFYHGVIQKVGCQACHEPHGGKKAKLLKEEGNHLCLACHDTEMKESPLAKNTPANTPKVPLSKDKTRGHPILGHPVEGKPTGVRKVTLPPGEESLSCLSCHNPHGGANPNLYIQNKRLRYELCIICHPK